MFDKKQCRVVYTFVHGWLPVYSIYTGILKVKLDTMVSLRFDKHLTFTCTLKAKTIPIHLFEGPSWSWSYGSWIYNNMCNQCLSPIKLWVLPRSWWSVLGTTLCDKVCQWPVIGLWFSPGNPVSTIN